jgi:hypothetical protein
MRAVLVLALCAPFAAVAPAPEGKDNPPAKKELFAKEDWYKDQKGKEETFNGTLQKKKDAGGIGVVQRFNPYQLVATITVNAPVTETVEVAENVNGVIVKKTVVVTRLVPETRMTARDVYVGGKNEILDGYIGKTVKITGKAVMMELEGAKLDEIWPAAIELSKDEKKPEEKKDAKQVDPRKDEKKVDVKTDSGTEVKILGRGAWKPATKSGDQQQLVIRSAEELAKASGLDKPEGEDAQKKATETVAKALKVDGIDWKKQMVIVVTGGVKRTGGYSVEITKIETADKVMTVHWKLNSPKPGSPVTQTITHPALTVIVDQFEGKVVFDPPAAKDGEK